MVMLRLLSFAIQSINLLTLNAHSTTGLFQISSSAAVNKYSSTEINGAGVIYSSSRFALSISVSDVRYSRGMFQSYLGMYFPVNYSSLHRGQGNNAQALLYDTL